mmetsp:Transcript_73510/g.191869  ORF Transcript_73510/g.191869 Transcript_73510/m.191869 type:complete len:290 (+) Transcript_73510:1029-1898(+)
MGGESLNQLLLLLDELLCAVRSRHDGDDVADDDTVDHCTDDHRESNVHDLPHGHGRHVSEADGGEHRQHEVHGVEPLLERSLLEQRGLAGRVDRAASHPRLLVVVVQGRAEVPAARQEMDGQHEANDEVDDAHATQALEPGPEGVRAPLPAHQARQAPEPHQPREARGALDPRDADGLVDEAELGALAAVQDTLQDLLGQLLGYAGQQIHPEHARQIVLGDQAEAVHLAAIRVVAAEEEVEEQIDPEAVIHNRVERHPSILRYWLQRDPAFDEGKAVEEDGGCVQQEGR